MYPTYTIKWCLVDLRYVNKKYIDNNIISKYSKINNHIYGIKDYLNLLGIDLKITNKIYKNYINIIVNKMLDK